MYFWHLSTFSQNYICEAHPCVVCGTGTTEYLSPVSINSSSFSGTYFLSIFFGEECCIFLNPKKNCYCDFIQSMCN